MEKLTVKFGRRAYLKAGAGLLFLLGIDAAMWFIEKPMFFFMLVVTAVYLAFMLYTYIWTFISLENGTVTSRIPFTKKTHVYDLSQIGFLRKDRSRTYVYSKEGVTLFTLYSNMENCQAFLTAVKETLAARRETETGDAANYTEPINALLKKSFPERFENFRLSEGGKEVNAIRLSHRSDNKKEIVFYSLNAEGVIKFMGLAVPFLLEDTLISSVKVLYDIVEEILSDKVVVCLLEGKKGGKSKSTFFYKKDITKKALKQEKVLNDNAVFDTWNEKNPAELKRKILSAK